MELSVTNPFPFEALPRVWGWIENFRDRISDDFSPRTQDEFVAHMGAAWPRYLTWAIRADGELGGLITFERFNAHLGTAHIIMKPDFQGRGMAVKALRIAFGEIFGTGIGKLSLYTTEGNLAVGSLICVLGGKREGCLYGQALRGGKAIDVWVYGLSKAQFEDKTKANAANHGNTGRGVRGELVAADDADNDGDGSGGQHGAIELPHEYHERPDGGNGPDTGRRRAAD